MFEQVESKSVGSLDKALFPDGELPRQTLEGLRRSGRIATSRKDERSREDHISILHKNPSENSRRLESHEIAQY